MRGYTLLATILTCAVMLANTQEVNFEMKYEGYDTLHFNGKVNITQENRGLEICSGKSDGVLTKFVPFRPSEYDEDVCPMLSVSYALRVRCSFGTNNIVASITFNYLHPSGKYISKRLDDLWGHYSEQGKGGYYIFSDNSNVVPWNPKEVYSTLVIGPLEQNYCVRDEHISFVFVLATTIIITFVGMFLFWFCCFVIGPGVM